MAAAWETDNTWPTHAGRSEIKPTLQSNWKAELKHCAGGELTPSAGDTHFLPGLPHVWHNEWTQLLMPTTEISKQIDSKQSVLLFLFFHQNFEILRAVISAVFLYRLHFCVPLSIENTYTQMLIYRIYMHILHICCIYTSYVQYK